MNSFLDAYQLFRNTGSCQSIGQALMVYIAAFEARDADTIVSLLGDDALVEIPLLRPARLFGRSEIWRGHDQAFATMDRIELSLSHPIAEKDGSSICCGELLVRRSGGLEHCHETGIVAEMADDGLKRISLYFDSRNIRR